MSLPSSACHSANRAFYLTVAFALASLSGLAVLLTRFVTDGLLWEQVLAGTWDSPVHAYSVGILLVSALLLGCCVWGVTALYSQWRATSNVVASALARLTGAARPVKLAAAKSGVLPHIDVVDDSRLYSFCYGFRKPRICVSTGLVKALSADELEAVIRHERAHLENRDPIKILLSKTLSEMLFFLPIASALHERYFRAKELAADDYTVNGMGSELPLASALLKTIQSKEQAFPIGLAAIGSLSVTEARIERLLNPAAVTLPDISTSRFIVSFVIVAMVYILSAAPSYAVAPAASPDANCHAPVAEVQCPYPAHCDTLQ